MIKVIIKVISLNVYNFFYYWVGLFILFLNKIRHLVFGYTNPRTFPVTDFKTAIEYDFKVVDHWIEILEKYTRVKSNFKDKSILELGPGADLGVGLIILSKGAKKYTAIDVNNLVEQTPTQFYEEFFEYMNHNNKHKEVNVSFLCSQLKLTILGKGDKLNYICRRDFDITSIKEEDVDLVFSQAAFEHFDDVGKAISQLSQIVKSGTILITEVDLKTHTRWIRDLDPLNIYRYSDFIYSAFKFSGSPNRLRPSEYQQFLEKNGWSKTEIIPLTKLNKKYLTKIERSLYKRFREPDNNMDYLTIMICATKK
ncbi:hypothetical protein ES705_07462 [subsurface metagenome]